MLNFLLFLYLGAFKISCSAELSMKILLQQRDQFTGTNTEESTRHTWVTGVSVYSKNVQSNLY